MRDQRAGQRKKTPTTCLTLRTKKVEEPSVRMKGQRKGSTEKESEHTDGRKQQTEMKEKVAGVERWLLFQKVLCSRG